MRLFVAIALPDEVAASLAALQAGVPGARWTTREQMHLTLRFIGACDGREFAAVDDSLIAISAPSFSLMLKGVGQFGGTQRHAALPRFGRRESKSARFEPLVDNDIAILIPVQQLDPVAALVVEDEHMTREGIAQEVLADLFGQAASSAGSAGSGWPV